jgi:hypothetical protein
MSVMFSPVGNVLAAYASFSSGNPSRLIDLLGADVIWSVPGASPEMGRENVASRLTAAVGAPVELLGVRVGESVIVLEFTRPWWKRKNRRRDLARSIFDIRGEQSVRLKDGRISRIDSRERAARPSGGDD